MNKFSEVIKESRYEDFVLTKSEFISYKIFINQLFDKNYKDREVILTDPNGGSIVVYKAYNYEKSKIPGREFSVLGKVNTNRILLSKMWKQLDAKNFEDFKNKISESCSDLFDEDGKFFKSNPGNFSVWDTIRFTEIIGEKK